MNKKKIFPLFSPADGERLRPILDALREKGFRFADERDGKAPVLLVLSADFAADEAAQESFFAADSAGRTVIPLDLDGAEQNELVRSVLMARNAITASGRTPEEIASRVASAEAFARKNTPLPRLLVAAALVLALGAGVWIWQGSAERRAAAEERKQAVQTAARVGLGAEDLARIQSFAIIGDKVAYSEKGYATDGGIFATQSDVSRNSELFRLGDYAYPVWGEGGKRWHSTEDGHEYTLTRYDDLSFLKYMPNLRSLTLVLVEADAMPSLAGLGTLEQVELSDCVFPDYEWLSGAPMFNLFCRCCSVSDFSPLSGCENLLSANLELTGLREADLSAFSPPNLNGIYLQGWKGLETIQLDGLRACPLGYADFAELPVSDLGFLSGVTTLKSLSINAFPKLRDLAPLAELDRLFDLGLFELPELRDVSAVGSMHMLQNLTINGCPRIEDYSALAGCTGLAGFRTQGCGNLRDASFLRGIHGLQTAVLIDCLLEDLDFLRGIKPDADGLSLFLSGDIRDYSGLASVGKYKELAIAPRGGDIGLVLPYLENAKVARLELVGCRALDLAQLPALRDSLKLQDCELRDLKGLSGQTLRALELWDLPSLESLDGLEDVNIPSDVAGLKLTVIHCPRLSGWDALETVKLSSLDLEELFSVPERLSPDLRRLQLRNVEGLRDLGMLDSLSDGTRLFELRLAGVGGLYDLSSLSRFKVDYLEVPPQLAEQAEALKESGNVGDYGTAFSDEGWQDGVKLSLKSLDELETLPEAMLRHVTNLCIAGDLVVDRDRFDVNDYWDEDGQHFVLRDRDSGEETELSSGGLRDLSALSPLTGLRYLELIAQSAESLEGLQRLGELETLIVRGCPALRDASAAFTLQGLRNLEVSNCPIGSIRGVQNLTSLEELYIFGTEVSDLTPLPELDSLRRVAVTAGMEEAIASLEGRTYEFELDIW